jgi:hypothetical protein
MRKRFNRKRLRAAYRRFRSRGGRGLRRFRTYVKQRRSRRRKNQPKILTMRWFKKNWLMIAAGLVGAYFLSAKFKDWADTNVISKIKK